MPQRIHPPIRFRQMLDALIHNTIQRSKNWTYTNLIYSKTSASSLVFTLSLHEVALNHLTVLVSII